jgi:hypothetical protein
MLLHEPLAQFGQQLTSRRSVGVKGTIEEGDMHGKVSLSLSSEFGVSQSPKSFYWLLF